MSEIYHYGIKGMRWGIRRTDAQLGKRNSKKEVKRFEKAIKKSGQAGSLVTMATLSKFSPSDYDQLSRALDSGRLIVKAKIKKNYSERSLDLYLDGQKNPTLRARMEEGERYAVDFLDKADELRYSEFVKYYNEHHGS